MAPSLANHRRVPLKTGMGTHSQPNTSVMATDPSACVGTFDQRWLSRSMKIDCMTYMCIYKYIFQYNFLCMSNTHTVYIAIYFVLHTCHLAVNDLDRRGEAVRPLLPRFGEWLLDLNARA